MVHGGEVADADPDTLAELGDQRRRARKHLGIEGERVEPGGHARIRTIGAGLDVPFMQHQREVPVRPRPRRLARMDHQHADEAHALLGHGILVGVIHEGAVLDGLELVAEGLARLDRPLRQARNAVHVAGQDHRMPVRDRRHLQLVRDVDPDPIALHRLDDGPRRAAVIAPALRLEAGRERVQHVLGHQVEHLDPVDDLEGQGGAVRDDDGRVVFARQPRREGVVGIDGPGIPVVASGMHIGSGWSRRLLDGRGLATAVRAVRLLARVGASHVVVPVLAGLRQGIPAEQCGAGDSHAGSGERLSAREFHRQSPLR